MDTTLEPHQQRIQKIGKLLSVFVTIWLILSVIAMFIVMATLIVFKVSGHSENRSQLTEVFAQADLIPGIDAAVHQQILEWDYDGFLEHFWLTFFQTTFTTVYIVVTMILILRIARSMKAGDVLSETAIKSMHLLGWLYLIQGIIGMIWGSVGQFLATTNTCELIYFSFIRDTCLYSFTFSGGGIEWGLLVLAISYILKHARILRDEQMLVV